MEANINFDEASKLWRENKQYLVMEVTNIFVWLLLRKIHNV